MTLIKPTECPYYLISRVALCVTSALKKAFASKGVDRVKPAYLGVLLVLWREDGLKAIDLSRRAGLEPSSMTGLLDRMEGDGLLNRSADPHDRRAQRIHLTEEGRGARDPVMKVVDKVLADSFEGISEEEISRTMGLLRRVMTNTQKGMKS